MNALEQLSQYTTIVADTGDINAIAKFTPRDATTNPSLILKAAEMPEYDHLFQDALQYGKLHGNTISQQVSSALEKLFVNFGVEILQLIPGRVSTEVDAMYSFDTEETIRLAKSLIAMYYGAGIEKERVLIKVAATWEGINAVRELEKEGIHTNSTLLFSDVQALAVAQAGGTLISPFVGRITDWYKKAKGVQYFAPEEDLGVLSVVKIYKMLKGYGFNTEIMGASFRSAQQVIALAGCDLLTISPEWLTQLQEMEIEVPRVLSPVTFVDEAGPLASKGIDEPTFRWKMNEDAMATEKLAEGIRLFNKDARKLEDRIRERLQQAQ